MGSTTGIDGAAVPASGALPASVDRRTALRGSAAAAVGISTMALPTAAQAFSLTSNGVPVSGLTVYWSDTTNGSIGRLVYRGLDAGVDSIDTAWLTGLTDARKILVDGGFLYYEVPWAGGNTSLQGVWRVNIADRTATRVATGTVVGFTIDSDDLYFNRDFDGIYRVNKDGSGSVTTLHTDGVGRMDLAIRGDTIYMVEYNLGRITSMPKTGLPSGSPTVVATLTSNLRSLEVTADTIYTGESTGRVSRFRLDGTPVDNFFVSGGPEQLQVVDSAIFAATSTSLMAFGPDGGNRDVFASRDTTPTTLIGTWTRGIVVVP